MKHTFFFIGTLSKSIPAENVASQIPSKIAEQQSQFKTGLGDDKPENIEIVEYAYSSAEPNCWLVYAKWKIK
jgi:hypothetical protein